MNLDFDNLKIGLDKSFPNSSVKILIQKNIIVKKTIFEFCNINTINDTNDSNSNPNEIIFSYSNPIFQFDITNEKIIFTTKYLSPSMYFINKFYKQYTKNNEYYSIEFTATKDLISEESELDLYELSFDSNHLIPIEFINMLIDFYDNNLFNSNSNSNSNPNSNPNTVYLVKKITLHKIESNENFNDFIENIENLNINCENIKESYFDYRKYNQIVSLKILDPKWIIIDKALKLLETKKNYSKIVDKFFNFVSKSKFITLENFDYTNANKHTVFYKKHILNTIYKSEGGIDLSLIFLSFGYSQFLNTNCINYHLNFIRCCCNCNYCTSSFNLAYNSTFHKNIYSGSNSDLLCVVVLNEMLIKFGLVTELSIGSRVYSNKSDGLGSDLYYWLYGFTNK